MVKLTAASTFAGDSSLGLESIDMILNTILSTCKTAYIILIHKQVLNSFTTSMSNHKWWTRSGKNIQKDYLWQTNLEILNSPN